MARVLKREKELLTHAENLLKIETPLNVISVSQKYI